VNDDATVRAGLILRREIPAVLPVGGARLYVNYFGMGKICYNCFRKGHIRRDCSNPAMGWLDYLVDLKQTFGVPDDLLWGTALAHGGDRLHFSGRHGRLLFA
jgi:hypothetical protein